MKMSKKLLAVLSAGAIMTSMAVPAFAATEEAPITILSSNEISRSVAPRAVVYDQTFSVSDSVYESSAFSCPSGNGTTLRIFFRNDSNSSCKVILKRHQNGTLTNAGTMTVKAGENRYFTYGDPSGKTFEIWVQSSDGGAVAGQLRANQY